MTAKPKSAPTIEERMAAIEEQHEANQKMLEDRLEMAETENDRLSKLVDEFKADREATAPGVEVQADVFQDPYGVQNPLVILKEIPKSEDYPFGQVLSWKDSDWRNGNRGWAGWVPVRYEDDIRLEEYIQDPPKRFEGEKNLDGYVRRAGLLLCRIDKRMWNARLDARESDDERQRGALKIDHIKPMDGVTIEDRGSHREEKPSFGATPEPMTANPRESRRQHLGSPEYNSVD